MKSFKTRIHKLGIRRSLVLPPQTLKRVFKRAGRSRGPIPVLVTIEGRRFPETIGRFRGKWILYVTPSMQSRLIQDVAGDVSLDVEYDDGEKMINVPAVFAGTLRNNRPAAKSFNALSVWRRKQVCSYLQSLKGKVLEANVARLAKFLAHESPHATGGLRSPS